MLRDGATCKEVRVGLQQELRCSDRELPSERWISELRRENKPKTRRVSAVRKASVTAKSPVSATSNTLVKPADHDELFRVLVTIDQAAALLRAALARVSPPSAPAGLAQTQPPLAAEPPTAPTVPPEAAPCSQSRLQALIERKTQ